LSNQGTQGTQGIQGSQGLQGTQGVGSQGSQGLSNQGTQGIQGTQGLQGTQGVGSQGSQGLSNQGSQGIQGLQGTQGLSNQGTQGSQGSQGLQGLQGLQGTQGLSNQGTQGSQGSQGLQGTQGVGSQGSQGLQGAGGAAGPSTTIFAADDITSTTLYPVMVAATGSNQTAKARSTSQAFVFNSSSNLLTASQLDLTASATANDSVLYLSGAPTGSSGTNGLFGIGTLNFSDTNIIANFKHDVDSYAQIVVQNINSGSNASSDIVVNNDRSAGTTYFGDFGINGTTFAGGGPFGDVDGTYLYSAGGTLSLGSLNAFDVKIATNNTERVRVSAGGSVGIGTTNPTTTLQVNGTTKVETSIGSTQSIWWSTLDSKNYSAKNVDLLVQPETAYSFDASQTAGRLYEPTIFSHALTSANGSYNSALYSFQNETNVAGTASNAGIDGIGFYNYVTRNSITDISSYASNSLLGFSNNIVQGLNVDQSAVTGFAYGNRTQITIQKATATNIYGSFTQTNVGVPANNSASSTNAYGSYNIMQVGAASGTGIGTLTNYYGYYVAPTVALTGQLTNYYGLYLATPIVSGTLTNRYSIYSSDTSSPMYHAGSVGIGTTNPTTTLQVNGTTQIQTSVGSSQSYWLTTLDSKSNVASPVGLLVQPETAYSFDASQTANRTYLPTIFSHALTSANESYTGFLYSLLNITNVAGTAPTARINGIGFYNQITRNSTTDISSYASNSLNGSLSVVIQGTDVDQSVVTGFAYGNRTQITIQKATATNIYNTYNSTSVAVNANNSASSTNAYGSYNIMQVGAASGTGIGTLTNYYGYYVAPTVALTGQLTNYYGLYLATPIVSGTLTNRYSIYSSDTSSPMYHAGSVGIGTTVPLQKLHVLGNLLVSAGSSTGQHITQKAYELNSGTLSWEGSAGQLFSITNNLTSGSIFSVNDVSGIPSIDVNADGTVLVAPYGGSVGIGTTNPQGALDIRVGSASTVTINYGYSQLISSSNPGITFTNNSIGNNNTTNFSINASRNNIFGSYNNGAMSGNQNTIVGYNNNGNISGSNNNIFGSSNLGSLTGNDNILIGDSNNYGGGSGSYNTLIGQQIFYQNSFAGSYNVAMGYRAAYTTTNIGVNASYNVILGYQAAGLGVISASNNVALGSSALYSISTGNQNVALGSSTGIGITTGNQNVVIGFNQTTPILTGSNQLVIGAGNTSWINGNSSYNVGIGTTLPTSKLHVVGTTLITGITTVGLGSTSTPPNNSQLSFELTSDTNLRIKVRGSDGVLRSGNITLS
jgi:hypothetical protein